MTLYSLARRYRGIHEIAGARHHPLIQWWLSLAGLGLDCPDETPWCGAFVFGLAWELDLPRPAGGATARSWLEVGVPLTTDAARIGWDVVVLQRGSGLQPGPEVTRGAPGHVGVFAGWGGASLEFAHVLGGNQGNEVNVASYSRAHVLGVRRLLVEE